MAVYSINDLEKLTGIKAHTLRIWEKRYGIIEPHRTAANIRYYEDDDLKKLLNVALLNRNGYKISAIARLSRQELLEKVSTLTEMDIHIEGPLDSLTLSMIELDEEKFNRIINKHIELRGFEHTIFEVIFPLLDKVSSMWMTGSMKRVHEYFLSFMIRRKIVSAIEQMEETDDHANAPRILIFLTSTSYYELSFILAHYLLRSRGFKVVNIGSSVLPQDILDAANLCKPDYLFTFYPAQGSSGEFNSLLRSLVGHGIRVPILVAGAPPGTSEAGGFTNVKVLNTLEETILYFESIGRERA